jgi:hypothetical protein
MKTGERRKMFRVLLGNSVKKSMKLIQFSTDDKEKIIFVFPT